jgi:transcription elongation factor GreA
LNHARRRVFFSRVDFSVQAAVALGFISPKRSIVEEGSKMVEKVPMTAEGYAIMQNEVQHLKQSERPRIINAIEEARSHGDLSENAEYHAAKEAQGWNETKIQELEDKMSRAEVIDPASLSGSTVKFGAKLELIDGVTDAIVRYQIVGDFEADVKKGRISLSSPIARALIGKKQGDEVEVHTPGGSRSYEIKKVAWK